MQVDRACETLLSRYLTAIHMWHRQFPRLTTSDSQSETGGVFSKFASGSTIKTGLTVVMALSSPPSSTNMLLIQC